MFGVNKIKDNTSRLSGRYVSLHHLRPFFPLMTALKKEQLVFLIISGNHCFVLFFNLPNISPDPDHSGPPVPFSQVQRASV